MNIQAMKEKLKPKTSHQAAYTTTGTSAAITGVIVWAYPALQAGHANWPAMNLEAAWGLTVIIMAGVNAIARLIPMRYEPPPPTIYQDDE
jgi:hypothetical protein